MVFGNGAATDVANLGEYLVLAAETGLFALPGECSGFMKLRGSLLAPVLKIDTQGRIACSTEGDHLAARLNAFGATLAG